MFFQRSKTLKGIDPHAKVDSGCRQVGQISLEVAPRAGKQLGFSESIVVGNEDNRQGEGRFLAEGGKEKRCYRKEICGCGEFALTCGRYVQIKRQKKQKGT